MASATLSGNPSKFIIMDNDDANFSVVGTWGTVTNANLVGPPYGFDARTHAGVYLDDRRRDLDIRKFRECNRHVRC